MQQKNSDIILTDIHGRQVRYLRFSVTDRCNLYCSYCRSSEREKNINHHNILRYEEILSLAAIAVDLGIEKVRLTGGEPFMRKGFMSFLEKLRALHPTLDIRITTNATLVHPFIKDLCAIGINAINISLDSFNEQTFAKITGQKMLSKVLLSIDEFLAAKMPVKINAVAMRGVNDAELKDFINFAYKNPVDVRFIEYMPMGEATLWSMDKFWSANDILIAAQNFAELSPVQLNAKNTGPAKLFSIKNGLGRFGLITPLSNHFCNTCNRLRITSDGNLRTCLFADKEYHLRSILRHPKLGLKVVQRILELASKHKPLGIKLFEERKKTQIIQKHMNGIGG